jgi:queuosine precursor transporter
MENLQNRREYHFLDIISSVFVTVLIISNIASSAKIIDWGISLFDIRLAFDAGTILFPVSYIFGDVLTEVYGYKRSRRIIWTGFACLALTVLIFWLIGKMPGEGSWENYAGQAAYQNILGGMSSGGIAAASLLAYLAGEFSNSFILSKMKIIMAGRKLWMRTIGSTLVGEGIDTLGFIGIASALGVFPWGLFFSLTITNYIFKVGVEVLMTPVTYFIINFLKHHENEDYYDYQTNYNPFTFRSN